MKAEFEVNRNGNMFVFFLFFFYFGYNFPQYIIGMPRLNKISCTKIPGRQAGLKKNIYIYFDFM